MHFVTIFVSYYHHGFRKCQAAATEICIFFILKIVTRSTERTCSGVAERIRKARRISSSGSLTSAHGSAYNSANPVSLLICDFCSGGRGTIS